MPSGLNMKLFKCPECGNIERAYSRSWTKCSACGKKSKPYNPEKEEKKTKNEKPVESPTEEDTQEELPDLTEEPKPGRNICSECNQDLGAEGDPIPDQCPKCGVRFK